MKKVLSLALSLALLCTLILPASAVEGADQRLTQVTLKVKAALDIPDSFDDFSGDLTMGEATPQWRLVWSGQEGRVNVTADETGKVLSYNYNTNVSAPINPNDLRLPKRSMEECRAIAAGFLDRVLESSVESASFQTDEVAYSNRGTEYVTVRGNLLFHKLPTPFSFRVTVRLADGVVTSFSRSDAYGQFLGGVPSQKAAASLAPAAKALRETLALRLEYVQEAPGEPALLRYLPNAVDTYYVDGQTGKLVNLTELVLEMQKFSNLSADGMTGAAPSAAPEAGAGENRLSEAEQAGIAKLEGVQSKEALDEAVRSITALGLNPYTLARFSYEVSREDDSVTASLTYTKSDEDAFWRRIVTVDAKTADLQSVSSYIPYNQERKPAVNQAAAQRAAEEFLQAQRPDYFPSTALYPPEIPSQDTDRISFLFSQQENGYFFPANMLSVAVDASDGSIASFSCQFDETVTFDSADGVLAAEEAAAAWADTYRVMLCYTQVPIKLDPSTPGAKPLMDMGYSFYSALKLGYSMEQSERYSGLDAKTGKPVADPWTEQRIIAYTDLEGVWGRAQVEELAAFGYGWLDSTLDPQRALTQRDMVALLGSLNGYYFNESVDPQADELYQWAYEAGILTRAERQDKGEISRMSLITVLLNRANYGEVAALKGIYHTGFADGASIPEESLGYAALAQAMGIVTGDRAGNLAPTRTATRLEALLMLYNFMKR